MTEEAQSIDHDPFEDDESPEEIESKLSELAADDDEGEEDDAPPPVAADDEQEEDEEAEASADDERAKEEKRHDAAIAALRRQNERTEKRLGMLLEAIHSRTEDDEEAEALALIPDFDDDPKGHIHGLMALEKAKKEVEEERQRQAQQVTQLERDREEIENFLIEDRKATLEKHPDFADAETFLATRVVEDIMFDNPTLSQEEAVQEFQERILAPLYAKYGTAKKSLSTEIYKRALRVGYQPVASNGRRQKPKSRVRELAKRQRGSRSLANAGGRGGSKAQPTVEEVNEMSDDEFSDFLETVGEKGFREIASELADYSE